MFLNTACTVNRCRELQCITVFKVTVTVNYSACICPSLYIFFLFFLFLHFLCELNVFITRFKKKSAALFPPDSLTVVIVVPGMLRSRDQRGLETTFLVSVSASQ